MVATRARVKSDDRVLEPKGVFNMIGYLQCRDCGSEMNAADLVAKLCPACLKKRAAHLSVLQGQYEQAVRGGDADRAVAAAAQVRSYQQAEGVRLRDVPDAYRVK